MIPYYLDGRTQQIAGVTLGSPRHANLIGPLRDIPVGKQGIGIKGLHRVSIDIEDIMIVDGTLQGRRDRKGHFPAALADAVGGGKVHGVRAEVRGLLGGGLQGGTAFEDFEKNIAFTKITSSDLQ